MSALPKRNVTIIIDAADKAIADSTMAALRFADPGNTFSIELAATRQGAATNYWAGLVLTEKQYVEFNRLVPAADTAERSEKSPRELRDDRNLVVKDRQAAPR